MTQRSRRSTSRAGTSRHRRADNRGAAGPPPWRRVKAVAGVVNGFVLIAGIRNVAAPGMALPIIPEDDTFQDHFHDGSRKVEFLFQMLGVCFCAMALNKLIAVFTTPESTFLRQKLFFTYGLCDLAMAIVVFQYKGLPDVRDGRLRGDARG